MQNHQLAPILAASLAMAFLAGRAQSATAVLSPTLAFRIFWSGGSDNEWLSVYTHPQNGNWQRSLLKFDLSAIPPGATISSATLTLTAGLGYSQIADRHTDVAAVSQPWDANATWTRASAGVPWQEGVPVTGAAFAVNSDVILAPQSEAVTWDVTRLVAAWNSGSLPNYGMVLSANEGDSLHFYSASAGNPAFRPTLSVTYSVEVSVPKLTITPAGPGAASISWTPATPGFVLQESLNLEPGSWTNSASGATNPVVVPTTLARQYFRLAKP